MRPSTSPYRGVPGGSPWRPSARFARIHPLVQQNVLVASIVVLTVGVDASADVWTAAAPWIWPGFRSVVVSASELSLALVAVYGFTLNRREAESRGAPGARAFLGASAVLAIATIFSALVAPAPLLSAGRLIEIVVGVLAAWTLSQRPALVRWIVVGLCGVILLELPLTLLQETTQSTFPTETLLYGLPRELPASASGAAVVLEPNGLRWQRAMGSFPHPNVLGGFLATSLVLGLVIFEFERVRRPPRRALLVPFALIWLAGWLELGLTFSRTALLATVLGVAGFGLGQLADRPDRRRLGILGGGVIVAGLVAFAVTGPILPGWLLPRPSLLATPSATQRVLVDDIGLTLIRLHPFLGVGAGNFSLATLRPPIDAAMVDPVHAVPLLVASESGIVAGVAWLALVLGPAIAAWRPGQPLSRASRGVAAITATLLTLSLLDHYLWTLPQGQATFWITLGAAASLPRLEKRT